MLHTALLAVLLALLMMPQGASHRRRAGHDQGRCHACRASSSPEVRAARDALLVRAGCIEPPGDGE